MITNLEEYLAALRTTSDSVGLREEYGIFDNYLVYLRVDFESLVTYFVERGASVRHRWHFPGEREQALAAKGLSTEIIRLDNCQDYNKVWIDYEKATFSVTNIPECHDSRFFLNSNWLSEIAKDYPTYIVVHPHERLKDPFWDKAIAQTVITLTQFCIENKVPACFPYANGKGSNLSPELFLYHRP